MKNNTKKKGFTLIELIIVIAILGILATIAIPRFSGYQESAKKKADIATAKTIANATAVLIADGTIAVDTTNAKKELLDNSGTVSADETAILGSLNEIPKVQLGTNTNFLVVITTAGQVQVYADTDSTEAAADQLYPTVGSNYTN